MEKYMDERLEKALDFSNYMVTLSNQKRILNEQFIENTLYYYNGCQFTITKELINFVNLLNENDNDNTVLIDDNNIPVNIDNINSFLIDILDVYFSASNTYLTEYNKLKSQRSIEKLVDYD